MDPRSIVCGVDFSKASAKALREAAALARRSHGRLLVLFVEDPILAAAARAAQDLRGSRAAVTAALGDFVSTALGRAARPRVTEAVVDGQPVEEILKAAKRSRAGLVVIGTRGLGRAARLLLGSTADGVLRYSRIPVLAVPS